MFNITGIKHAELRGEKGRLYGLYKSTIFQLVVVKTET